MPKYHAKIRSKRDGGTTGSNAEPKGFGMGGITGIVGSILKAIKDILNSLFSTKKFNSLAIPTASVL